MILKTGCLGCVFASNGCTIGKDVYFESGNQLTEGFCSHKRSEKWLDKLKSERGFDAFRYADGEHETLSLIIHVSTLCECIQDEESRVNRVRKYLKTINESADNLSQVIFSSYQTKQSFNDEFVRVIRTECKVPWTLDRFFERPVSIPEQMERSSRLVETAWFLGVGQGYKLAPETISQIKSHLKDPLKNTVAFYRKDKDSHNVCVPTYAFRRMEGNREKPWFEKVQEFKNWQDVCIKVH